MTTGLLDRKVLKCECRWFPTYIDVRGCEFHDPQSVRNRRSQIVIQRKMEITQ